MHTLRSAFTTSLELYVQSCKCVGDTVCDSYVSMRRLDLAWWAEENDLVPTVMTASGVERKGHGKALPMSWPSTAAKEVPSRDGSPYTQYTLTQAHT